MIDLLPLPRPVRQPDRRTDQNRKRNRPPAISAAMDRQANPASDFHREFQAVSRGSKPQKPEHESAAAPRPSANARGFPARFSRKGEELGGFLRNIGEYVEENFSQFPSERAKIAFCVSLLSGDALSKPSRLWSANGGDFGSLAEFCELLLGMCGMEVVDLHDSPLEDEEASFHGSSECAASFQDSPRCSASFRGSSECVAPFQGSPRCAVPSLGIQEREAQFPGFHGHMALPLGQYKRAAVFRGSRGCSAPSPSVCERALASQHSHEQSVPPPNIYKRAALFRGSRGRAFSPQCLRERASSPQCLQERASSPQCLQERASSPQCL
ncbi:hypothetical protein C0J45_14949 [Silurus meridionalis]|nr:hypothetical protein C0J45_14949 [Silurus meridionalis]